MKKIRNIFAFITILGFMFNSFGFIFSFLIEIDNTKEEAFEKIALLKSKEKIEVLSFSKSIINEVKVFQRINKKEIRYEGKMYDIVKEEMQKDKIIFYCIHDEKEDKLEKDFAKTVNRNLNQKESTASSIYFNQQIQYADYGTKYNIESPDQKIKYSNNSICNYILNTPKILTPPPKYSLI